MNIVPQSTIPNIESLTEEERNKAILESILHNREISNVDVFLNPPAIDDKFFEEVKKLFGDELQVSVELIKAQLLTTDNKSVVIHGDYDVDGVSATAILWEAIYYGLGYKNVMPFIPHRVDHGYGLSEASINDIESQLSAKGLNPGLLITVDCGITSKDAVEYAKDKGFTVIVTDHHTRPEKEDDLPQAEAVLHSYKLCGAGVAWVLARSLSDLSLQVNFDGGEMQSISSGVDLVALATVADVQELTDFNRALVIEGLSQLTQTKRIGLQAMYDVARILGKPIGTYEVGWVIGPRLNATGRLEHALDALRLLVVRNQKQAYRLARKLNNLNFERQQITEEAVDGAIEVVEREWDKDSPIVVSSAEWHEGVIGLIAGRLVRRFNAPAIAISITDDGIAKGSARSIAGINIVELLRTQEELFTNVGGHAAAAGFSLAPEKVELLKSALADIKVSELVNQHINNQQTVDIELDPLCITWSLYKSLSMLEPHGVGNPRPTFGTKDMKIIDKRTVGRKGDHLVITFENNLRSIGFGLGEKLNQLGDTADVIYTIDKDDYRGNNTVQIKIKEIE